MERIKKIFSDAMFLDLHQIVYDRELTLDARVDAVKRLFRMDLPGYSVRTTKAPTELVGLTPKENRYMIRTCIDGEFYICKIAIDESGINDNRLEYEKSGTDDCFLEVYELHTFVLLCRDFIPLPPVHLNHKGTVRTLERVTLQVCEDDGNIWVTSDDDQNGREYKYDENVSDRERMLISLAWYLGYDPTIILRDLKCYRGDTPIDVLDD